jgi:hypothetical protein
MSSTQWLCKLDSGEFDERGEPIQYWFTYTLGTLTTAMHMATNKYWWKGERESEVSGILLEPVMPIEHQEVFYDSKTEYDSWESVCKFWANKN